MRPAGCVGRRLRTSFRYELRCFADWMRLMTAAARWPPRSDPANSQFERPSAMGQDSATNATE